MSSGPGDDDSSLLSGPVETFLRALAAAPDVPTTHGFAAGERLGRFEIVRLLGQGGFGAVFEARDTDLGRHVAVKVLRQRRAPPPGAAETPWVELFRLEAAAGARMDHPGIVTVFDFGVREGRAYLVMELLRGRSLRQRLEEEPLPAQEAVEVMIQVVGALAHAHARGVVHRDLKPSNIFLREDGRAVVVDFGLASFAGSGSQDPLATAGTPRYMAPEQQRGEEQDERTDLFAVGLVLHELLAPNTPDALQPVIERATQQDPGDRYQRAEVLLKDLVAAQRSLWDSDVESEQPFRYLDPFAEADRRWFYGRRGETTRLARMLDGHPVVAVVGPSGAGKSSLVHAGLVPRLRRAGEWEVLSLRPGAAPLEHLHARLGAMCGAEDVCGELPAAADLVRRPGAFGTLLRGYARARAARILVVVDQLEELITHDVDTRQAEAFVQALLGAADDVDGPIRCVLTGRDDYLGRLARLGRFGEALAAGMLLLGPPDAAAMTEAMVGPVRRLGFELEAGLAEQVVADLADEVAPLPLLQLAASRLWERRDEAGRRLSLAALAAAGGVEGVLAAHAEEVLQGLSDPGDVGLAMDLLQQLCTADGLRRQRERDELVAGCETPAAARRILDRLVAGRVLTATRGESGSSVEISHESLIRGWRRLADRLHEDRDAQRFRERVTEAAALWEERGRAADLLWTGRTLEDALRWRERHAGVGAEATFLAAAQVRWSRRRRLRRTAAVGVALTALLATGASLVATRIAREEARAERVRGVVQSAASARDPLLGALLLQELATGPAPPGAATAADVVSRRAIPLALLRGHTGQLNDVAISPDGAWVATASYDRSLRVWPADGRGDPRVLEHGGGVLTVEFTPAGDGVASGGRDGTVVVWSFRQDTHVALQGCPRSVYDVAVSPDGRRVAAACSAGYGLVWRLDEPAAAPLVLAHEGPVWRVAFSPDGERVLTGSADRTARLWDVSGGAPVVLRGHTGTLRSVAFSPDGAWLLTGGDDASVHVWPAAGGPARILRGHEARVWMARFSPDGEQIVSVSDDGTARVWPMAGGAPVVFRGDGTGGEVGRFSPDGARVLVGGSDGTVQVLAADGGGRRWLFAGHTQSVAAAEFSADGTRLVTASVDGTARVWSVRDPDPPGIPAAAQSNLLVANFSPDGRRVSAGGVDGVAWAWPVDDPTRATSYRLHRGRITSAVLSPDGSLLATSSLDHTLRIVPVDGSGDGVTLRAGEAPMSLAAFSPDGARVLGVCGGVAYVWPCAGGAPALTLRAQERDVVHAAFDPAGGRVVVTLDDGLVLVVDSTTGAGAGELRGHDAAVIVTTFSADGRRLLTVSRDGTARVWSLHLLAPVRVFGGPEAPVTTAALDPAGLRVVTGAPGGELRLWTLAAGGEAPLRLRGHSASALAARFTPDGRAVVTVSTDGTTRVWSASDGRQMLLLTRHRSPLEALDVSADGRYVVSASYNGLLEVHRLRTWEGLRATLAGSSTACLSPEQRRRYLSETGDLSWGRYAQCERSFGRTPLKP